MLKNSSRIKRFVFFKDFFHTICYCILCDLFFIRKESSLSLASIQCAQANRTQSALKPYWLPLTSSDNTFESGIGGLGRSQLLLLKLLSVQGVELDFAPPSGLQPECSSL